MFAGVAFLGLFAGTIASAVEVAGMDQSIKSVRDLTPADNICTPSPIYQKMMTSAYNINGYVSKNQTLASCVNDIRNNKATGIFYDVPMLKYLFVSTPSLSSLGFKVIDGIRTEYIGPAYSFDDIIPTTTLQSKLPLKELLDFAHLSYLATENYQTASSKFFPDTIIVSGSTESELDWWYCGPLVAYVTIYWLCCGVAKYIEGEFNSLICCRIFPNLKKIILISTVAGNTISDTVENSEKNYSDTAEEQERQESNASGSTTFSSGNVELVVSKSSKKNSDPRKIAEHEHLKDLETAADHTSVVMKLNESWGTRQRKLRQRNNSFLERGDELRGLGLVKTGNHSRQKSGHNRMLFADGPEFSGLSREVHSLHRLLLSQSASMMMMVQSMDELSQQNGTNRPEDHETDHETEDDDYDDIDDDEQHMEQKLDLTQDRNVDIHVSSDGNSNLRLPSTPSGTAKVSISLADLE